MWFITNFKYICAINMSKTVPSRLQIVQRLSHVSLRSEYNSFQTVGTIGYLSLNINVITKDWKIIKFHAHNTPSALQTFSNWTIISSSVSFPYRSIAQRDWMASMILSLLLHARANLVVLLQSSIVRLSACWAPSVILINT